MTLIFFNVCEKNLFRVTHLSLLILFLLKVNDVADALILNRLFRHLFNNGIVSSLYNFAVSYLFKPIGPTETVI